MRPSLSLSSPQSPRGPWLTVRHWAPRTKDPERQASAFPVLPVRLIAELSSHRLEPHECAGEILPRLGTNDPRLFKNVAHRVRLDHAALFRAQTCRYS